MTKFYAIGKPNKEIRIIVQALDESVPELNKQLGEVFVEVEGLNVRGKINRTGKSIIAAGVDMTLELDQIRAYKNSLLQRCDFAILPDSIYTVEEKAAWTAYRQELRDLTTNQPDKTFAEVVWPEPPFPMI